MENTPMKLEGQGIDFSNPEIIKTLKATVAQGLNDSEFAIFVEYCKGTRLNPFKREVWAIKTKSYTNKRGEHVEGKLQIMTGINGFFTIANDKREYDGIESGLVDPNGDFKSQSYPKGDFIGAWSRVHRKDRKIPVEAVAMISEYDKSRDSYYPVNGIWNTMKRVMITKCAESVALRKAFPQELNGLYTAEEMPPEYSLEQPANMPQSLPAPKAATPAAILGDDAPPEPRFLHSYNLTEVPPEKLPNAMKLLIKAGAKSTDEEYNLYWDSPVMVTKLEDFRIKEGSHA